MMKTYLTLAGVPRRSPSPATVAFTIALGTGLLVSLAAPATGRAQGVPNGTVVQNFSTTSTATVQGAGDATFQPAGSSNTAGGNGTAQGLITNASTANDGFNIGGFGDAVNVTTLGNFFAVDASRFVNGSANGTEGSGLSFGAFLSAGQRFSFDYSFLTSELTGAANTSSPDFVFVSFGMADAGGNATAAPTSFLILDSVATGLFTTVTDPNSPFNLVANKTGVVPFPAVATAGNYRIAFGVVDANTFDTQSGLAIDNITVVPEPGTLSLLAVGIALGGSAVHRRRRRAGTV